jgi:hypothetical protein
VLLAIVMLALFGIYGCGGSGSEATTTAGQSTDYGDVAVSLTDAPGDFGTYTVDVVALSLTKANGTEVSALPVETRIDFNRYTEMTEFLTAASVPSGAYTAATLTLDYTKADIWVEDGSGDLVQVLPENIVDDNGDSITTLEMTVQLEGRNHLTIAPGIPAHLLLDFDLNATHRVDLEHPSTPVVTVDPLLVADVNRTSLKLHRVRGALDQVGVESSSFSLFLRPFYCPLSGNHRQFGSRTVTTTDQTVYEIDGEQFSGADGLEAMAALKSLTAVVAVGDLTCNPLRFEARQVYAGTSVPGGIQDVVQGNVIGRSGDMLTVKGATLIRGQGSVAFNDEVTVQISDETVVTRQLSADPVGTYGKDDISVGQKVIIFGTLTEDGDALAMDAVGQNNCVRMMLTTLQGTTVSLDEDAGLMAVEVLSFDKRSVDLFDFSGTNSDPVDYQVDAGELDLSSVEIDAPVKIGGFIESFGNAPPDFNAHTLVHVADLRAMMKVSWEPATENAFQSIGSNGVTLNFEGTGRFHHIFRGCNPTDLTALDPPVSLLPPDSGRGGFVIHYGDGVKQYFVEFEDFADALAADAKGDHQVRKLHATGEFNDATGTLTADYIDVKYIYDEKK